MTPDERLRILSSSSSPERAMVRIRSRQRREARTEARNARMSVETFKREKFREAVEQSFTDAQRQLVPRVGLRVKE